MVLLMNTSASGASENQIDVSFLLTAYNFESYIADAVNSLLALDTPFNYEIIVLDDASADNTWNILSGISDSRLKTIRHEKNQGAAASINTLFSLAKGRYIARFDGDDRWRANFLSCTIPVLEENPAVGLVYADVAMMDERGNITSAKENLNRPVLPTMGNELLALLETSYICAPAVIARKEAWQSVLPWTTNMGPGDWWGHLKMANAGWLFAYVDEVIADYRLHGQGMHIAYVQTTQGEQSINKILDDIFATAGEKISAAQARKIRARHYQRLAFAYIAQQRYSDAKRILFSAIRKKPVLLLEKNVVIQCLALCLGYSRYISLKRYLGRSVST
jgi:glycosyltransferase involved in cell wall biosynthesis